MFEKERHRISFLCGAILVLLVGCVSKDKDASALTLMKKGTLSMGVEIGYPPFEDFANDDVTPVGYDVDFAKALGENLGVEVVFINPARDGLHPFLYLARNILYH